ncbi:GNAT family N-acetyltransferase [Parasedimentitalea huanghaiensis]|uniref:GNAT family N-acetyltransferase n=1 Tax=Parasedimentitalea huanghaiensis TaxID=2682100 RepID=A0A6L6WIE8_9RHOB|nr:GNAT family N-acetyltransferase [Zongyanglinia huanghaiensis]MVO17101.1 GNAT family N-acetyltransferase [Zongyanglinia huanghaiensis]
MISGRTKTIQALGLGTGGAWVEVVSTDARVAYNLGSGLEISRDPDVIRKEAAELSSAWAGASDFAQTTLLVIRCLPDGLADGCAYLQFHNEGSWRVINVDHLAIRPEKRRLGYASALLKLVSDIAAALSYDAVTLLCATDNVAGFQLYTKKHGYHIMSELPASSPSATTDQILIKYIA